MLDSQHEHHHIHKLELSPWKQKPSDHSPRAAVSPQKNISAEGLISELGLGFPGMEGFEAHGNPRTVCRICHREFPSGRALGGHMRVHGPMFNPAAGRKRKLILTDSDSEEEEHQEDEEEEEVLDVAASFSIEGDPSHLNKSGDLYDGQGAEGDDYGVMSTHYYMAAHHKEHGSIYSLDVSRMSEMDDESTAKKNPLYELRHNPKKSRRFADEDLSMKLLASGHGTISASGRTRVCSVCGKAFWSWKALSGHMRCHPEREWRGVLPPVGKEARCSHKRSSIVSSFDEHSDGEHESDVEDKEDAEPSLGLALAQSRELLEEEIIQEGLRSTINGINGKDYVSSENTAEYDSFWPTGKRSRRKSADMKARSLPASPKADQDEHTVIASEAATFPELGEQQHFYQVPNFLFMLAEAARTLEGGLEAEEKHGQSDFVLFKGTSKGKQADSQAFGADRQDSNSKGGAMKFECSTCKKAFSSPQALGGHRASHKKMKGCFARTTVGEQEIVDELTIERESALVPLSLTWQGVLKGKDMLKKEKRQQQQAHARGKGYECTVCHRLFATGQALGGHKSRCHFREEKASVAAAAASISSSNKQLSGRGSYSKHDEESVIDLNLPASTVEDSEVGCAAVELRLFTSDRISEIEGKGETCRTTESPAQELSLGAPWATKHLARSTSWELEGRWPAVEPAMAF